MIKHVVFLAAILGIFLPHGAAYAEAEDNVGIISIEGDVQIQRSGEESWIKAQEDMALNNNDKIKTSADSSTQPLRSLQSRF